MSTSRQHPTFADGSWIEVDGNGNLVFYSKTGATLLSINNQGTIIGGTNSRFKNDSNGLPVKSNNITLAGQGFGLVVASVFEKAETATDANILTYTPGAADELLVITIVADVSAAAGATNNVQISYKDSNGTAVTTQNISKVLVGGSTVGTNWGSATGTHYAAVVIMAQTGTNVVIGANLAAGTIAYNISVTIQRLV